MQFTEEQYNAIHTHDKNLVVVAGAGSGKTRVLVERYLALLENNPDWPLSALVAITFTSKAAEEMRDRVRQSLERNLYEALDSADVERWTTLITQIDSARINTIHGLCASILRANAAAAGIDPSFVVFDEIEAEILREDVVNDVLTEVVAASGAEVEILTEYEGRAIRKALLKPDLPIIDELPVDLLGLWQDEWLEGVWQQSRVFLNKTYQIGTFVPAADDKLGDSWDICLKAIDSMQNTDSNDCYDAINKIAAIDLRGGSYKKWGSKETIDDARAALKKIREAAKNTIKIIGEEPDIFDERAAQLLPLWISLINKVRATYHDAKTKQGALDFDDLETMTRNLLVNNPQVRERYRGAEFKHLLVDEFQDTNANQWDIVRMLADLETPGSMFVVGDPKQSIYAFRGADVSVFGAVQKQITDAGGEAHTLSKSFRTHQPLVGFFNQLFGKLLLRDESSPVAGYQVQLGKPMTAFRELPPSKQPALQLLIIDEYEHDESGQTIASDDTKSGKLNITSRRRWEAFEIAKRLQQMVASGYQVFDKEKGEHRPVEYGDVAILFRALSNVNLYEEVFKAVGLPFVTIAGRGYYDRQEVWDLLNLLQAVYNPADNLSLASVLRSPLFSFSDDALLVLRLQKDENENQLLLWAALNNPGKSFPLDELERLAMAQECLHYLRGIAGRVTISELLRAALEETGYLAVLSGLPDGARRRGNVEKLLEKAQSTGKVTLGEFSRYLHDLSTREAREGEAVVDVSGAVSIMTIHASKGLEFPVIVLADSSWKRRGGDNNLLTYHDDEIACKVYDFEQDKLVETSAYRRMSHMEELREKAESLRLLYVAATRAQDYLIVGGQARLDNKSGEWQSSGWLDLFLETLDLRRTIEPCDDIVQNYGSIEMRVTLPCRLLSNETLMQTNIKGKSGWDVTAPLIEGVMPSLLRDVKIHLDAPARHLAATHIADLGSVEYADNIRDRDLARERFLRQVFHDAPTRIETVSNRSFGASARQIGEIVHEALRYGHLPGDNDSHLLELLCGYAWRQGISDDKQCNEAANRAYRMLQRFKDSQAYGWLESADEVYRELPFIYRRQGFVIHGIIDVLFHLPDGRWIVMDYKTSYVAGGGHEAAVRHARRYYLQLGIYAEAVQKQLGGIVPEACIHYIRYGHTVVVQEVARRKALERGICSRIKEIIKTDNS